MVSLHYVLSENRDVRNQRKWIVYGIIDAAAIGIGEICDKFPVSCFVIFQCVPKSRYMMYW